MVLPQLIIQNKRQELAVFLGFKGGLENKRSFFPFFFFNHPESKLYWTKILGLQFKVIAFAQLPASSTVVRSSCWHLHPSNPTPILLQLCLAPAINFLPFILSLLIPASSLSFLVVLDCASYTGASFLRPSTDHLLPQTTHINIPLPWPLWEELLILVDHHFKSFVLSSFCLPQQHRCLWNYPFPYPSAFPFCHISAFF